MKARFFGLLILCLILSTTCLWAAVLPRPFDGSATITQSFDDTGVATGTQHKAIDYALSTGTLLRARKAGTIAVIIDNQPNNWDPVTQSPIGGSSLGNKIVIDYNDGSRDVFGHCKTGGFKVSVGVAVQGNQWVAESDNSGTSTGPHLHHEYWIPDGSGGRYRVDPTTFDENNLGRPDDPPTPPPDDTKASLATVTVQNLGDWVYKLTIQCHDRTGQAGGVRSIHTWLHIKYRTPQVWIDLGKHFSRNNPQTYSTSYTWDALAKCRTGCMEIFVKTEGGDGRLLMQYGGKNITIRDSTNPPWRAHDEISTDADGVVHYLLVVDTDHGFRALAKQQLWIDTGINLRKVGGSYDYSHEYTISGFLMQIPAGRYQLYYYFEDKFGEATNGLVPSGRWITIPELVIPPESHSIPLNQYDAPSGTDWHIENMYIAASGQFGPYGPHDFDAGLNLKIEGTQHHPGEKVEHVAMVYGDGGDPNKRKRMGAKGYGYWMKLVGNVNNLPTGLHKIGCDLWVGGRYYKMTSRDAWLWTDFSAPIFDQILAGPEYGDDVSIIETPTLRLHVAMMDPGYSGTKEFQMVLVGQGQRRAFAPNVLDYHGEISCDLRGLPQGRYALVLTYSRDAQSNINRNDRPTGIEYNIIP